MGGLRKYMPWTYAAALVGSMALIGAPFFSGFYSKESIIGAIRASSVYGATFAQIAVVAGLFVTGFYTFRLFFYVFHGRERFQRQQLVNLKTAEKEKVPQGNLIGLLPGEKPHESPWIIRLPLLLLAIPSVVIGYVAVDTMLYGTFFDNVLFVDQDRHVALWTMREQFENVWSMTWHELMMPTCWLAWIGMGVAWYFYMVNPMMPIRLRRRLRFLYRLLVEQYYLDRFYRAVLVEGTVRTGRFLWKGMDVTLIDDWILSRFFVGGATSLAAHVTKVCRMPATLFQAFLRWATHPARLVCQNDGAESAPAKPAEYWLSMCRYFRSGYLYQYVLVMIVGLLCLLFWFVPMRLL